MLSHFSAIGFQIKNVAELENLAQEVISSGASFDVDNGHYMYLQDDSGAEIWVQLD